MPHTLIFILRPILFFFVTVLVFIVSRYCFYIFYPEVFSGISMSDFWDATLHGIPMDCSVAGYLTIIPWLLSAVSVWLKPKKLTSTVEFVNSDFSLELGNPYGMTAKRGIRFTVLIYSALVALLIGFLEILDASLYPVWGFRLDLNPFNYFFSAPGTVTGSLSGSQLWGGIIGTILVAVLIFAAYFFSWYQLHFRPLHTMQARILTFTGLIFLGGLIFVTIRGGVTVSTMNLSRAYFSPVARINHISINPIFSLLSAAAHQNEELAKYKFFPSSQLPELLSAIAPVNSEKEGFWEGGDSIISTRRPDVYIIILESFSSHLFPSLGGEDIALNLDKVAEESLLFTNAYANSFRTDRALPAILNGFPGLPDVGIIKDVSALERLPSIGEYLRDSGYSTEYYYGGDLNFANFKALLVSGGFDTIIGDKDFPLSKVMGKWGAHDDVLFERVREDHPKTRFNERRPIFRVIQTSSSHEPFKVPYHKLKEPAPNAFAFTDSVVGSYISFLKRTPDWRNSLVILVPDHYGAYPPNLTNTKERHHIPIIFTGGALLKKGKWGVPMTQVSISGSLLGLLGINHDRFFFSRNVFDPREGDMIYFYDREQAYMQSDQGTAIYNIQSGDMTVFTQDSLVMNKISPLNPRTQLRAWMQAISTYYNIN